MNLKYSSSSPSLNQRRMDHVGFKSGGGMLGSRMGFSEQSFFGFVFVAIDKNELEN